MKSFFDLPPGFTDEDLVAQEFRQDQGGTVHRVTVRTERGSETWRRANGGPWAPDLAATAVGGVRARPSRARSEGP